MIKIKYIVLPLFVITQVLAFGQLDKRTVKDRDFTYYFYVSPKERKVPADDNRMYYWLHNGKISNSEGAYYGSLLKGEFSVLDRNDQLTEQGEFKEGLKDGVWRTWDANGYLKNVYSYRNGLLHGANLNYEKGNLISKVQYRRGLKHGKAIYYDVPGEERVVKFKRGTEKQEKPEKPRTPKAEDIQKIEEIKDDSLTEKRKLFGIFGSGKKEKTLKRGAESKNNSATDKNENIRQPKTDKRGSAIDKKEKKSEPKKKKFQLFKKRDKAEEKEIKGNKP